MSDLRNVFIALALFSVTPSAIGNPSVQIRRGDVDGNGVVDTGVVITSPSGAQEQIYTRVYSGDDGGELYTIKRSVDPDGDLDGNGVIGANDLALLLRKMDEYGAPASGFDVNGDGVVNAHDVLV